MKPSEITPEQNDEEITEKENKEGQENAKQKSVFQRLRDYLSANYVIITAVLGCIIVQAVASFFFLITTLTFQQVVSNVEDFASSDKAFFEIQTVFNTFSAITAAICAALVRKFGYLMVVVVGAVLMLYSLLSSSLVKSAKVLSLPYGIFGACSYTLLRVTTQIAMLDYLNHRRMLASTLTTLGAFAGQVIGIFAILFSDMMDDAQDEDNWINNLRILETTTVFAFAAAALLAKPSFVTGNLPDVLKLPPFYLICTVQFFIQGGDVLLQFVLQNAPEKRGFDLNLYSILATPFFISIIVRLIVTILFIIMVLTKLVVILEFLKYVSPRRGELRIEIKAPLLVGTKEHNGVPLSFLSYLTLIYLLVFLSTGSFSIFFQILPTLS